MRIAKKETNDSLFELKDNLEILREYAIYCRFKPQPQTVENRVKSLQCLPCNNEHKGQEIERVAEDKDYNKLKKEVKVLMKKGRNHKGTEKITMTAPVQYRPKIKAKRVAVKQNESLHKNDSASAVRGLSKKKETSKQVVACGTKNKQVLEQGMPKIVTVAKTEKFHHVKASHSQNGGAKGNLERKFTSDNDNAKNRAITIANKVPVTDCLFENAKKPSVKRKQDESVEGNQGIKSKRHRISDNPSEKASNSPYMAVRNIKHTDNFTKGHTATLEAKGRDQMDTLDHAKRDGTKDNVDIMTTEKLTLAGCPTKIEQHSLKRNHTESADRNVEINVKRPCLNLDKTGESSTGEVYSTKRKTAFDMVREMRRRQWLKNRGIDISNMPPLDRSWAIGESSLNKPKEDPKLHYGKVSSLLETFAQDNKTKLANQQKIIQPSSLEKVPKKDYTNLKLISSNHHTISASQTMTTEELFQDMRSLIWQKRHGPKVEKIPHLEDISGQLTRSALKQGIVEDSSGQLKFATAKEDLQIDCDIRKDTKMKITLADYKSRRCFPTVEGLLKVCSGGNSVS